MQTRMFVDRHMIVITCTEDWLLEEIDKEIAPIVRDMDRIARMVMHENNDVDDTEEDTQESD